MTDKRNKISFIEGLLGGIVIAGGIAYSMYNFNDQLLKKSNKQVDYLQNELSESSSTNKLLEDKLAKTNSNNKNCLTKFTLSEEDDEGEFKSFVYIIDGKEDLVYLGGQFFPRSVFKKVYEQSSAFGRDDNKAGEEILYKN